MIKNYIKIAWRNLTKHKLQTFINLVGLACGLSFSLLIAAYVWQETKVNQQLKAVGQLYLLQSSLNEYSAIGMLPRALKENYPHLVEDYFRYDGINVIALYKGQPIQSSTMVADSSFFDLFGFKLKEGSSRNALNKPNQAVISASYAKKVFGNHEALGKQLIIKNFSNEEQLFTISGVLQETGENTVLNLTGTTDLILPIQSTVFFKRPIDDWNNLYIACYLKLKPHVSPKALQPAIQQLIKKNASPSIAEDYQVHLSPLKTYHLDKHDQANRRLLYTVSVIALGTLLLAMINFVHISIHTASRRLKEIGIRKVVGGTPLQLRVQFMAEAFLIVSFSAFLSVLLYPVLSGILNAVLGKPIPKLFDLPFKFWLVYAICGGFISLLAGAYPAFRLSVLPTVPSVKGKLIASGKGSLLLKGLVSIQFTVAMIVLISSFIIGKQVTLLVSKQLGYDKDYLLTVPVPRDWSSQGLAHTEVLRTALSNDPIIEDISLSYDVPGAMSSGSLNLHKAIGSNTISANLIISDRHFAETYNIPLLAGHFFGPDEHSENPNAVVINEAFMKSLGFHKPEEAINSLIYMDGGSSFLISGVTRNFYPGTMHMPVGPLAWTNVKNANIYRYFSIRIKPGNIRTALQQTEQAWKKLFPEAPFDYTFLDDKLAQLYRTEIQLQQAGRAATMLSIVIVLLGIIALVSHNLQKRTKEIGIRKVLGASGCQIIQLFIKEVYPLFLLAALVSVPLSLLWMHKWLAQYAIKTALTAEKFLFPILGLAGITFFLIILQTIKTASQRPVNNLRDE